MANSIQTMKYCMKSATATTTTTTISTMTTTTISDQWKKHAFDLDLPNGKYFIQFAFTTGGIYVKELNEAVPPSIQIKVSTIVINDNDNDVKDAFYKIENTGHGIIIEINNNHDNANTKIRTTIWLTHIQLIDAEKMENNNGCSANQDGETSIVITELVTSKVQTIPSSSSSIIFSIHSVSNCSPLTKHLTDGKQYDGKHYTFGLTSLEVSSGPIYLNKGTYTITAKDGGFDAGDGILYFKAELRLVGTFLLIFMCAKKSNCNY